MATPNGAHPATGEKDGGHPPYLAHHWETPAQQFQAGKTGMWLFLSTEILLFGGLFCAYAVYRHNHPEIFVYAHQYLDKNLGGINTLILILSSLTAAWSVRAAQLGQQKLLVRLIVVTLLCGIGFMGIKAVEYNHKWKHGLLWGARYAPTEHAGAGHGEPGAAGHSAAEPGTTPAHPGTGEIAGGESGAGESTPPAASEEAGGLAAGGPAAAGEADPLDVRSNLKPAAVGPGGLAPAETAVEGGAGHVPVEEPRNVQVFFGIYFTMTGLHALHVIAGMTAWLWVLRRALRGEFSAAYYTPVDLTALYWHLVDLIWIYLFPLLYLIH